MSPAPLAVLLVSLVAAAPAMAGLYKCASDKGVVYQDATCPPGKELRNLETDPATLSVVPGTPVPASRPARAATAKPQAARPLANRTAHRARTGNPAERRFVHAGMSEAEVVMRIGRPDVATRGRGKNGRRWAYFPAPGDPDTLTTLTIAGEAVVDVERKVAR
jgi:hypothetical protein